MTDLEKLAHRIVDDIRKNGVSVVADSEADSIVGSDAPQFDALWQRVRAGMPESWRRIAASLPVGTHNAAFLLASASILEDPPFSSDTLMRDVGDVGQKLGEVAATAMGAYSDHDRRAIRSAVPAAIHILTGALYVLEPSRSASKAGVGRVEPNSAELEAIRATPWGTIADVLECPADAVTAALRLSEIVQSSAFSVENRRVARRAIEQLIEELAQFGDSGSDDAAKGHGLVRAALRIGVATLVGSLVGAPLSALAVNDTVVEEMIKTGIAGLVGSATGELLDWSTNRRSPEDPAHAAMAACDVLSDSTERLRDALIGGQQENAVELAAARTQATAAIYNMRVAVLDVDEGVWSETLKLMAELSVDIRDARPALDVLSKWLPRIEDLSKTMSPPSPKTLAPKTSNPAEKTQSLSGPQPRSTGLPTEHERVVGKSTPTRIRKLRNDGTQRSTEGPAGAMPPRGAGEPPEPETARGQKAPEGLEVGGRDDRPGRGMSR